VKEKGEWQEGEISPLDYFGEILIQPKKGRDFFMLESEKGGGKTQERRSKEGKRGTVLQKKLPSFLWEGRERNSLRNKGDLRKIAGEMIAILLLPSRKRGGATSLEGEGEGEKEVLLWGRSLLSAGKRKSPPSRKGPKEISFASQEGWSKREAIEPGGRTSYVWREELRKNVLVSEDECLEGK